MEFAGAHEWAQRFARMARDGEITADESATAQAIRGKAVELRQIMEETIAAIDKATADLKGVKP